MTDPKAVAQEAKHAVEAYKEDVFRPLLNKKQGISQELNALEREFELASRNKTFQGAVEGAKKKVTKLEDDLPRMKDYLDKGLPQEIEDAALNKNKALWEELSQNRKELPGTIANAEKELANAQKELKEAEKALKDFQTRVEELPNLINKQQTELEAVEKELQAARNQLEDLTSAAERAERAAK